MNPIEWAERMRQAAAPERDPVKEDHALESSNEFAQRLKNRPRRVYESFITRLRHPYELCSMLARHERKVIHQAGDAVSLVSIRPGSVALSPGGDV